MKRHHMVLSALFCVYMVPADAAEEKLIGSLLKHIANVNEKRMNAVKLINQPTKFNFAQIVEEAREKPAARSRTEKIDYPLVLLLDVPSDSNENQVEEIDRIDTELQENEIDDRNDIDDEILSQLNWTLRKSDWMKKCKKEAGRRCKLACVDSVRGACSSHTCKSKLKSKMKKECKRKCKDEFGSGSSDSSDSSGSSVS